MKTTDWQHVSQVLGDLAYRVRRLGPDHRRPEHFHEEKSEIAHELRRLQRVLPGRNVYGSARPNVSAYENK